MRIPAPVPTKARLGAALALLLTLGAIFGADPAGKTAIEWLDVSAKTTPSAITELRGRLTRLLEPMRVQLFGTPMAVMVPVELLAVPAPVMTGAKLTGGSTNTDGNVAWVLTATNLVEFRQYLLRADGVQLLAAPRSGVIDGRQASVSMTQRITINETNYEYGTHFDVAPRLHDDGFRLAILADVTDAVTNAPVIKEGKNVSAPVTIKTRLRAGLAAQVPPNGAVVVWNPGATNQRGELVIIAPSVLNPMPILTPPSQLKR